MGLTITSCSDSDDPDPEPASVPTDGGQFIIAAASTEASYLLQTAEIEEGEISNVGNGVEADAATHWLFPQNKYAYGLQYRQGNAGACNSFVLKNGELIERSAAFEMPRFTAFGTYEEYLFTGAAAATDQYAPEDTEEAYPKYGITYTVVDADLQVKKEYNFVTEDLAGNGEYYTVSGFEGVDNKVYTAIIPIGISAYGISQGAAAGN
jgi:hypothetical protein